MLKYKNYAKWFCMKIFIPESQIENIQKVIYKDLIKKYKDLLTKQTEILKLDLVKIHEKKINVLYEYLVIIGVKDFDEEEN